ncbi:hypothetical protein EVAR_29521_1 [Eumeta japonica]|uniref:Uncharacterized protein n=1 Tax=Eumeta variegata TaxID=151549 RepID=A0A4C1WEY2_EUMVA|nr:hypothetical protein EVAR_29521_1 [Eumeta japonica]
MSKKAAKITIGNVFFESVNYGDISRRAAARRPSARRPGGRVVLFHADVTRTRSVRTLLLLADEKNKNLSFKKRPVRRVEFRPIESKRPGSQNLSLIGSCTVGTAMLIFDMDSGPYCNGRRYLAPLNDYCQRLVALPS